MSINGAQSVRLGKTRIKFKNAFKEIQGPLKIYSDFKCIKTGLESYEGSCPKKQQDHIPCGFSNLVNQLFFTEVKMLLINFLKQF